MKPKKKQNRINREKIKRNQTREREREGHLQKEGFVHCDSEANSCIRDWIGGGHF